MRFDFSAGKNQLLLKERGISFEMVIATIDGGAILNVLPHPNPMKYPDQKIYVLNIDDYVYLVPFVRKDADTVFLKTIFPHRKLTREYLREQKT